MKLFLGISLFISIIGITILLILLKTIPEEKIKIKEITQEFLNKNVGVNGKIIGIKTYKSYNFQIITLEDSTGKIDATLDSILNLSKNQTIEITGKVTEYKNKIQIQIEKIKEK